MENQETDKTTIEGKDASDRAKMEDLVFYAILNSENTGLATEALIDCVDLISIDAAINGLNTQTAPTTVLVDLPESLLVLAKQAKESMGMTMAEFLNLYMHRMMKLAALCLAPHQKEILDRLTCFLRHESGCEINKDLS